VGLSGRYWITPEGVESVAGTEHGNDVKMRMLGLKGRDRAKYAKLGNHFNALSPEEVEIHRERGVPEEHLAFLTASRTIDPRLWGLREWGWVRVHDSVFNVWEFTQRELDMIQGPNMDKYWYQQRFNLDPHTSVTLHEEGSGDMYSVPVDALRRGTIESIKHAGSRGAKMRMFRNPHPEIWIPRIRSQSFDEMMTELQYLEDIQG